MPKINVTEHDQSWYYQTRDPSALTVLMPIVSAWGPTDPTIVDETNFTDTYGIGSIHPAETSYPIAASLVKNGVTVLGLRVDLNGDEASYTATGTQLALTIQALYKGTYGNQLKVSVSTPIVRLDGPAYDLAETTTTDWDTSKTYLYLGETTTEAPIFTQNHVYAYESDAWTDKGLETLIGVKTSIAVSNIITNRVLETLIYEFVDTTSEYYYTTTNNDAKYITVASSIDLSNAISATAFNAVLTGGTNTPSDTAEDFNHDDVVDKLQNQLASSAMEQLLDPLIYDFDIICGGGYNYKDTDDYDPAVVNDINAYWVNIARNRGTAIYLVDGHPKSPATSFFDYCGDDLFRTYSSSETHISYTDAGSYCAAFGPWCYATEMVNGVTMNMPGSYVMLIAWARAIANGSPMYLAPAGVKRASLGSIVKSTDYFVGSAVISSWQDNSDSTYSVNPIARLKQYGYVVYGNKTLLNNSTLGETSLLQLFSVRVLVNLIKRRSYDIALTLQFDQLSSDLFAEFKTLLSAFMDTLKYNKALFDYDIIADRDHISLDQLNQRTVPVKILISPNPAAENFEINLEIYPAGVVFSEDTMDNTQVVIE